MLLAALSLLACIIHATVLPDHLAEMWQHGVFMAAAVLGQGAGALLLPSGRRWVLWATLAGNALIVAVAVWAYGWGLPPLLMGDGREAMNWQVLACTVAEVALCALCAVALARQSGRDPKVLRFPLALRG